MTRPVSIRRNLLSNFLLVILLLAGSILAATLTGARQTVEVLSGAYTRQVLDTAGARLRGFFAPVQAELVALRGWGGAGLLETDDPEALRQLLVPALRAHPQLGAILVADDRGRESLLTREGTRWRLRSMRRDEWGDRARWLDWSDDAAEATTSWEELEYDPRRRPWFEGAAREAGVHWTAPYVFFSSREPGMTASVRYDGGDGLTRVVALDVRLSEISDFTQTLRAARRGKVVVATEAGQLIGLPADPRFEDPETRRAALLKRADDLDLPLVRDADFAWSAEGRPEGTPIRFRSEGGAWWAGVEEFRLAPQHFLSVTVLIPEADLLGGLDQLSLAIGAITLIVILVAVLRAVSVARRLGSPIEALVQRSDRIGRGDLGPAEPISSSVTEVQRLAEAQEGMRSAVRSLMKVERDLQLAREIQQHTLPEQLPELPDFSVAAWSEPAEETGGDAYDAVAYRLREQGPPELGSPHSDHALLLLADAAGHGFGPALSVTQVRAMLRMAVRAGSALDAIARHLNEQLAEDLPPGRFVTAWLGELDARNHRLWSFSAGQAPLLLYRAASGAVETLPADAPPLGVLPEMDVEPGPPLELAPGDIFAAISDGFFEAKSPDGAELGEARISQLIAGHAAAGVDRVMAELKADLTSFCAGAPAADDRTALLIQRRG